MMRFLPVQTMPGERGFNRMEAALYFVFQLIGAKKRDVPKYAS
jgi:hypothetical protein